MRQQSLHYADHVFASFGGEKDLVRKFGRRHSDYESISVFERAMWDRAESIVGIVWLKGPPRQKIVTKIERIPRCPYCKSRVSLFGQPDCVSHGESLKYGDQLFAGECSACGWWFCQSMHYLNYEDFSSCEYYEGVLKHFEGTEEINNNLRHERHKKDATLFEMWRHNDGGKLIKVRKRLSYEEMWGNVYRCNVRALGTTVNARTKLFWLETNSPALLLVTKGVGGELEKFEVVRDIFGAEQQRGGVCRLFVSTASTFASRNKRRSNSHFSPLGISLDLLDFGPLQDLLPRKEPKIKPWKLIENLPALNLKGPNGKSLASRYPW